jgi:hypothetical protein
MRVAISDKNIISLEDGRVTFRYKDSQTETIKIRSLEATEFIYQFLQHVLPRVLFKYDILAFWQLKSATAWIMSKN